MTSGGEPLDDGDSDPDTNLTIDFGFYQSSTPPNLELGGIIWLDANSNGIQEVNELPVSNTTINLTIIAPQPDGNDNYIHFGNRWTDENGFYLFGALPPGTYFPITAKSGWIFRNIHTIRLLALRCLLCSSI